MLTLPDGNYEIIYGIGGTDYRGKELNRLYRALKGQKTMFSLTRPSAYQKKAGWPEPPFVNINYANSTETLKEDWLGFVRLKESDIDFGQLLEIVPSVNIYGYIGKNGGAGAFPKIVLTVDGKFSPTELYTSHTKEQVAQLKEFYKKHPEIRTIPTQLKKSEDGKTYKIFYHNTLIGSLSAPKSKQLDDWLEEDKIAWSKLVMTYFDGQNPHYARLVISNDKILTLAREYAKDNANLPESNTKSPSMLKRFSKLITKLS